jgi:hypothetical protein
MVQKDYNGHGTRVASMVASSQNGIAMGATVINVKVVTSTVATEIVAKGTVFA